MRPRERALRERAVDALTTVGLLLMVGRGERANWARPRTELRHRAGRALAPIIRRVDPDTPPKPARAGWAWLHGYEDGKHAGYATGRRDGIAEHNRLRNALRQIQQLGAVCATYEVCDHRACRDSYNAWAIADEALTPTDAITPPLLPNDDTYHQRWTTTHGIISDALYKRALHAENAPTVGDIAHQILQQLDRHDRRH